MALMLLLLSPLLWSQTAAKVEAMLAEKTLTWAKTVVFVFEVAEIKVSDAKAPEAKAAKTADAKDKEVKTPVPAAPAKPVNLKNPEEAFQFAFDNKWLPKDAKITDSVRLDGIALLLMRSFNLKGGMFYSMGKSPHHAYRELAFKNVIRGSTYPAMPVSGAELLFMCSRLLSMQEEAAAKAQAKTALPEKKAKAEQADKKEAVPEKAAKK